MLHIAQRKDLYRNLATLFSYPDENLLALLNKPDAWTLAAGHFGLSMPQGVVDSSRIALEEAYTALFDAGLGGAVAPPYGSVYLDPEGLLMGPSTLQVAGCYAEAGLSLEGTVEPADFLATELEYLYFLVDKELQALAARNLESVRTWTGRQLKFLESWLLPWLPEFVSRLEARPLHPIYLWGAKLLLAFVRGELEWLKRMPPAPVR